jgi:hypothetical protein
MSILKIEPSAINTQADFSLGSLSVSGNVNIGGATIAETNSGDLAFTTTRGAFGITANTVNFLNTVANTSIAPGGSIGGSGGGGSTAPRIQSISYVGNDTAADVAGGQTITLTGSGFSAGATVIINSVPVSVVTFVNSTTLTFISPALSTGGYIVYVVNPDGATALAVPGIQYSGVPAWSTTAGSLGQVKRLTSINIALAAAGDAPITYSVSSGSLPAGIALNTSTGVVSGTTPNVTNATTYNFVIRATDAQLQDTDRSFSLNVAPTSPPPTVEYLVVAGGGGGAGMYQTGGGGGGGLLTAAGYAVTAGSPITVTVGAGGAGGPQLNNGYPGQNSVFGSITAYGGGYGGNATIGGDGGSGGGTAPYGSPTPGKGVYPGSTYISAPRQGHDGSTGHNASGIARGGAGGGAGGAGASGDVITNQGGMGVLSSISGTSTGYAGGGGGGSYGIPPGNAYAGYGGGGGGGSPGRLDAESGTQNTGGGGGGTERYGSGAGGAGGSGIVIIRYSDGFDAASATTGNPTVTVAGGYRVYKFTTSGSITI